MAIDCSSAEEKNNRTNSTSFSFQLVLSSSTMWCLLLCLPPHNVIGPMPRGANAFLGLVPFKKACPEKSWGRDLSGCTSRFEAPDRQILVPEGHLKIAHRFNGGWRQLRTKSRRVGGKQLGAPLPQNISISLVCLTLNSAVPSDFDALCYSKPTVESVGYFHPVPLGRADSASS